MISSTVDALDLAAGWVADRWRTIVRFVAVVAVLVGSGPFLAGAQSGGLPWRAIVLLAVFGAGSWAHGYLDGSE